MARNFGTLLSFPFLLLSLPPLPAPAVPALLLPFAAPRPPIIAAALSPFPLRQVNGQMYFCPSPLLPGIAANAGKLSLTRRHDVVVVGIVAHPLPHQE